MRLMTEITQNDILAVGGGDGRRGEGVGARSSTPAVAAGFAADYYGGLIGRVRQSTDGDTRLSA